MTRFLSYTPTRLWGRHGYKSIFSLTDQGTLCERLDLVLPGVAVLCLQELSLADKPCETVV